MYKNKINVFLSLLFLFIMTFGICCNKSTNGSDIPPLDGSGGDVIAFCSNRDGNNEIYLINADGSGERRLTNTPGDEWSPVWSPDGSQLVFHSNNDGNDDLYLINIDGTNLVRLNGNYIC